MSAPPAAGGEGRAGTVTLIGWTNVGKSSLLNRLVGQKLAAVADAAQTTRHRIIGVRHVPGRGQAVFLDTPGLHRPKHKMNRVMVGLARQALADVDLALMVIDASRGVGEGDREVARLMLRADVPRMLVLNKVDLVEPKSRLLPLIRLGSEEWGFADLLPVSARTGDGCERLLDCVLDRLPVAEPLFPEDYLTDQTERALAAEWIRGEILQGVREELPHATAVVIDRWVTRPDGLVEIHAVILVDRESQKRIVIGKSGELLKRVGTAARAELEEMLDRRVFLSLWVQVRQDWRNDERTLREIGLR